VTAAFDMNCRRGGAVGDNGPRWLPCIEVANELDEIRGISFGNHCRKKNEEVRI
jgi:hypothetical protein